MPFIYKRKTKNGLYSREDMIKAIQAVKNGKSIRKASVEFGIKRSTLNRYIVKAKDPANAHFNYQPPFRNFNRIFNDEQERELCTTSSTRRLNTVDCRKLAYEIATVNNIKVPKKWHNEKMASPDWLKSFRYRHHVLLSLRTNILTTDTSFMSYSVDTFFDKLQSVLTNNESFFNGARIYHLDEIAVTIPKSQKAMDGKDSENNDSSIGNGTEKETLVTTCAIVNASGQYIPPAIVFPGAQFDDQMLLEAPVGTLGLSHTSGSMTAANFLKVMKHFVQYTYSSKDHPTLLLYDNHESHLSNSVIDFAKKHGITILTFPLPHLTNNRVQPLDIGLLSSFKTFYNAAVDSWKIFHPGETFSINNVAECVGIAMPISMTPTNIVNAFRKSGIFPFDRSVFNEIDFLLNYITDDQQQQQQSTSSSSVTKNEKACYCGRSFITTGTPENIEVQIEIEDS